MEHRQDPHRASGEPRGACTSQWLAIHDDLADPRSDDPIARELDAARRAAVNGAQTTLDPQQMKEWTPNSRCRRLRLRAREGGQRLGM